MAMATHPSHRTFLRRDEAAALALALLAHVGLITWLALKPPTPAPIPLPERMTVTFSDQFADRSTSPEPEAEAAPAIAPVIAVNPVPEPGPQPRPEPAPQAQPPRPVARVIPQPVPKPVQQPLKPQEQSRARPQPPKAATKPAGGGGSRIGNDFLKGIPGGQTRGARSTSPPAQEVGPSVKAALAGAIARQLKPNWSAPQGVDADQLVTVLTWDLEPDGSLSGTPRVVGQSGITDSNRTQALRHAEQAIRAVRLAAPFDLPEDLYAAWKHVASFRFDRKLSQ